VVDREHCQTCGDAAVRGEVVALREDRAVVEVDGRLETVATDLVADVREGDVLLCHAGIALQRLSA
jgi:hydrogenase maturation factor